MMLLIISHDNHGLHNKDEYKDLLLVVKMMMMMLLLIILAFGGNANKKANIINTYEQLLLVRATCNIKIGLNGL